MTTLTAPTRPTMPLSTRVTPVEGLRHTFTLAWRTLVSIKHNPYELIDFSIQPIMFTLLFTYVFGGAISGSTSAYLIFALPGIIVQNTIISTLNTGTGLNTDLTKGVFDRLRSLPIARWSPLAGRIAADMVKQAWAITVTFTVGALMGFRVHNGAAGVLAAYALLLMFALAVSWTSVLIGVVASSAEKVQIFGFAVIFPLTFTSNAFAPTATMPGWLQAWVKVNPVTVLADAVRGVLQGGPSAAPVGLTLLWTAVLTLVFAPLAVRAFKRKI